MDFTVNQTDMKKLTISLLFLIISCLIAWSQGHVRITKDTLLQGRYYLFENEIYPGNGLPGTLNYILFGNDTVRIDTSFAAPYAIQVDLSSQKLYYVKKVQGAEFYVVELSEDITRQDTCKLYNLKGILLRYFTGIYNSGVIDTARLSKGFKIVIPSTPVLLYTPEDYDRFGLHYTGLIENIYQVHTLDNGRQIAISRADNTIAYLINGNNMFAKVDPVQDSALYGKDSSITYNKMTEEWQTNSADISGVKFLLLLLLGIIAIAAIVWFLFVEKNPVYAIYDGTRFSSFASANGISTKLLIKANKEFHGANMEVAGDKKELADRLSGEFLIVGRKIGFSLERLLKKGRRPVYCRIYDNQEDIKSFCEKIKLRESKLSELNPKAIRANKIAGVRDYLIGYTYRHRTPRNLKEMLESYGLSYNPPLTRTRTSNTDQVLSNQIISGAGDQSSRMNDLLSPSIKQKSIPEHLNEISGIISARFSEFGERVTTLEIKINHLNDEISQKNKSKPSLDLAFFKPEAQNILYALNRLMSVERDLLNYVNLIQAENKELLLFLKTSLSRFLSNQLLIREKLAYWKGFLESATNKASLSPDDMIFKSLAEDIAQFSSEIDKSAYIQKRLFTDMWDASFSNIMVVLEEVRNAESFLADKPDESVVAEIKGFAKKGIETLLETAKTIDLTISYLPLFSPYENYNLKDLEIDIFTSFDYFYNRVKEHLDKNHIVQIVSYGINSSKLDRSTKTKIKILP